MALYKRPGSKYYWMKFTFDSKLIQKSTKCKDRRSAETVESAYHTQLALGKVGIAPKKKPMSFEQAAKDYLAFFEVEHKDSPATFQRVSFAVGALTRFFGSMRVDEITRHDGEKFMIQRSQETSRRTGKPITADTINKEFTIFRAILERLVDSEILNRNPLSKLRRMKPNKKSFYVLSKDEENRYLMAAKQPLQDVASVILETGVRPKELYDLTRDRFDPQRRCIQIVNSKTESGNRTVWLSDKAFEVLSRRARTFNGAYLFPKHDVDGNGPDRSLNRLHQKAQTLTGLHSFRLYDCRHTFATRAVESGVDLLTLAAILGHANLKELRRYAHPSEEFKRDAMLKMERSARAMK